MTRRTEEEQEESFTMRWLIHPSSQQFNHWFTCWHQAVAGSLWDGGLRLTGQPNGPQNYDQEVLRLGSRLCNGA
jgi:hypothetical protein